MTSVDVIDGEIRLDPTSRDVIGNLTAALSWLAETEWSQLGYCPDCHGVSPSNIERYDEALANYGPGHLSDCRLVAMMRCFGVVPDMIS